MSDQNHTPDPIDVEVGRRIPLAADEHADQLAYHAFTSEGSPRWVRRIGKDQDPCALDGVIHDARPEVRA